MKKKFLFAKIGVVSTTVLTGLLVCGSVIASKNVNAISNFLKQPSFEIVQDENSNEDPEHFKSKFNSVKELRQAGKDLVEEIEEEGAVLLKNTNNALPLKKDSKVSLLSVSSVDPCFGGKGSAQNAAAEKGILPKQGLENAGLKVNPTLNDFYTTNIRKYQRTGKGELAKINDAPWSDIQASSDVFTSIQEYNDAAIFTISRVGGEGTDYSRTKSDGKNGDYLQLNANEESVLKGLNTLKQEGKIKKIIVLVNTSNLIHGSILENEEYGIDAALWVGATGITGFNGVGRVLTGEVNPSGHMTDIWFRNHMDNPVMKNFDAYVYPNAGDFDLPASQSGVDKKYSTYVTYQEGIYLGYRYAETRYYDKVVNQGNAGDFDYSKTIYRPFGYGESYTSFEYSSFSYEEKEKTFEFTVDVKNTGKVAGKDAIQIYVQKPYTEQDKANGVEKSAVELVGFEKSPLIKPNESATVKVEVDKEDLVTYDHMNEKTFVMDGGDYCFTVGQDSHDAINNILAEQSYTQGVDKVGNANLAETIKIDRDAETYSKSSATGKEITNLFDFTDINKYEGKGSNSVTYLSRKDWAGTFPTKNVELKMTAKLQEDLINQNLASTIEEDKVEYPTYSNFKGYQLIDLKDDNDGNPISFDDPLWNEFLDQLTWEQTEQLVTVGLQKTVGIPELGKPETTDENGPCGLTQPYSGNKAGKAYRTNDPDKNLTPPYYPSVGVIGATFSKEIATKFGDMLGEDAIWAGYAGFYGIGLNTHRSPYEGRAYEYWSEDPFLAGTMASIQTSKMQEHGCNAYIKHLALNEQETQRNGIQVWVNEQALREIYLKPFKTTVVKGHAMNAMAAFGRFGPMNAPACKELLTDWLRGECGLKGHVVSDMYNIGYEVEHFPKMLMAGCDIPDGECQGVFTSNGFKEKHGAVAQQMRLSAKRILYSTVHSIGMNGITKSTRLVPITPAWQIALISVDSVVGVLFLGSVGYAVYLYIKTKKIND